MNRAYFRGMRGYALLVLVVVVVVVVYLVATGAFDAGGGDDENDALALPAGEATTATTAEPGGEEEIAPVAEGETGASGVGFDQPFQFGDLRVRVTDLDLTDAVGTENDDTRATGRFAVVKFTARNTGRESLRLTDDLRLIDSTGRVFTPAAAASAVADRRDGGRLDALTAEIQPGFTVELVVVFDVATDAEGLHLRLSGGFVDVPLSS